MEPYSRPRSDTGDYTASRALFDALITRLSDPAMAARPEHTVEEVIAGDGRDLLCQALQDHLDARAAAEPRRQAVTGADQITRRRAEPGHTRQLATTLGQVQVTRIAYRAPAVSNLHPADARLALPADRYSFPLQRAVVHASVIGALRQAGDSIDTTSGLRIGTRQLMQITTGAARDVRDFYQQHTVTPAARTGGEPAPRDLLILSIDATGINMIDSGLRDHDATYRSRSRARARDREPDRPPSAQLSSRERTGRARMAVVTAVYDAVPAIRDAADVLPATAGERARRRPGPHAVNRQLDASIVDSTDPMTHRMFDRAEQRDPHHQRHWIALVDGNNQQIDRIRAEAGARHLHVTIIIDFIHILEYLWRAAEDLHPTQAGRAAFVTHTARDLLDHHALHVIADLNTHLDELTQTGGRTTGLRRTIAYLTAKQHYLDYHFALTMGWPIATGVIEGACRHLVKDRLDLTGARWSLPSAEAILLLRTVTTNGDFNAYWTFHLQQEHQRTHTSRYQHQYELAA